MRSSIRDASWIRQAFLLPEHAVDDKFDAIRRVYTTADQKFTDTTLGGNFAVNAWPQFTRYADIKRPIKFAESKGMGRFYSEVIDDNYQLIHIRCGLPKFNSLTRFFGDFYSVEAGSLAKNGRGPGVFFEIGNLIGTVVALPLVPFVLTGKILRFFLEKPASRYYYMKPTMPLYWDAVATIVNGLAANLGVIPRVFSEDQASVYEAGTEFQKDDIERYAKALPDIYRKDGGIDIYAVANRAQRLANGFQDAMEKEVIASSNATNLTKRMKANIATWKPSQSDVGSGSLKEYMAKYMESQDGSYDAAKAKSASGESDVRDEGWFNSLTKFYHAERKMGSDFVTFRVDHTGTSSESFSSSFREAGIASKMNGMSSSARASRFDLMDGNVDGAGVVKGMLDAATGLLQGLANGVSMQGVASLAGNAFVDIPKTWDSSTADLPKSSFTIPLRSPYGNDLSRLTNLLVPLSMLLAMALPLSAGKQSYTSPFLIELYNKGRSQIRLGMVESLSITRGVGDIGWTNQGKFLGIDVNITFADLTSVVHMPLTAAFSASNAAVAAAGQAAGASVATAVNVLGGNVDSAAAQTTGAALSTALMPSSYDDDNTYTDYLAVLGSLPLEAQINQFRKLKLRLTKQMADFVQFKSPAHFSNWAMGGIFGDVLKAVSQRTDRP